MVWSPCVLLLSFPHPPKTNFLYLIFRVLPSHPISEQLQLHHMYTMYLGLYLSFSFTRNRLSTCCIEEYVRETTETTGKLPLAFKEFAVLTWTTMGWSHNNQIPYLNLISASLSSQHLLLLPPLGLYYLHPHSHWPKMPGWHCMLTAGIHSSTTTATWSLRWS